jgi:hypothetical protein
MKFGWLVVAKLRWKGVCCSQVDNAEFFSLSVDRLFKKPSHYF